MKRGKFIVIDGMDGSGKGTQIDLLQEAVEDLPAHFTREPGGCGSKTAEFLREVILEQGKFGISTVPLCDFFLFWAARAQHVQEIVEPKRQMGHHVICDRYDSSTWAFQVYAEEKASRNLFVDIRDRLPSIFWPDAYIFLDLPAQVAYDRARADTARTQTRFDLKPLEYYEAVRNGLHAFKRTVVDPSLVYIVDANRPKQDVQKDVSEIVLKVIRS